MVKNNKGFTLVELLIAISILSFIFSPFMNSIVKSMEINKRTENTIEANYVAQKFLEDIKYADDLTLFPVTQEYEGFTVNIEFVDITSTLKITKDNSTATNGGIVLPTSYLMNMMYYETLANGSKIKVGTMDYDSTNDEYTLKVENQTPGSDILNVKILTPFETSLPAINVNGASFANIKVSVGASISESGKIILNNLSDKKLIFYEFDDDGNMLKLEPLVSINSGDVEIVSNLSTISQDGKNNYFLYSVEITVLKDGLELEKLISTVKK